MNGCRLIQVQDAIDHLKEPLLSVGDWLISARELLTKGARPISLFSQSVNDGNRVWLILASPAGSQLLLISTLFAAWRRQSYTAI